MLRSPEEIKAGSDDRVIRQGRDRLNNSYFRQIRFHDKVACSPCRAAPNVSEYASSKKRRFLCTVRINYTRTNPSSAVVTSCIRNIECVLPSGMEQQQRKFFWIIYIYNLLVLIYLFRLFHTHRSS